MTIARNDVHRLIWLNIASAIVVGLTTIAEEKLDFIVPLTGFAFVCLLGLGAANVVGMFLLWKNHRSRAFLPIASYIGCMVAMVCGIRIGVSMVMANTFVRSDTFLSTEVRKDLEGIAAQLHGHNLKDIFRDRSAGWTVHTIDEQPAATVSIDLLNRLEGYKFVSVSIDDTQSLVVFSGCHHRTWYHYLYASDGLEPAYVRPSTITEVDIESWKELSKIVRQGPVASECDRMQISFEPSIAYSTLEGVLSETALAALRQSGNATFEEKAAVIAALNRQRLSSSRLIESPWVTYVVEARPYLCIGCKISDSFWVTRLLQKLLRDGIIVRAEDNRHLLIKKNLTKPEERQIEWLHVGMMNFLYGNLLEKKDHHYSRELGGGWYFERD